MYILDRRRVHTKALKFSHDKDNKSVTDENYV